MIKFENCEVLGWEHAIRGMRNPMNSWEKRDSYYCLGPACPDDATLNLCKDECQFYKTIDCESECIIPYIIGPNDHDLMMRLRNAGTDHRKFLRMITVYVDVTAPIYWLAEMDTYKVGVVRNSCSFMHRGVSRPFEISDFSIKDERIYKILSPLEKKTYELEYPYETTEFKPFIDANGRTYRVYKNGLVIREGFEYTDNYGSGRTRYIDESEATVYQNKGGYFVVKLSGRNGGQMLLHRLVASVWCEKPDDANQVNHIDGNKGNNSAENLEWVSASENMQHGIKTGLYDELGGIHQRYKLWKNGINLIPVQKRMEFKLDCEKDLTHKELAEKWGITPNQANNIRYDVRNYEYEDLFQECYVWDSIIEHLNYLRSLYLETKDDKVFQAIRCLMPQGYMQKATFMLNYEVLANIYKSRKTHKLDEWRDFCVWIESLPYGELITGKEI